MNCTDTSLPSHREAANRYRGCLLGGAVGDALGYPVEFLSEEAIRAKYGSQGICSLSQAGMPALISDDTQMTLFAADSVLCAKRTGRPLRDCLWQGYREWLGTQGDTRRMDDPTSPKTTIYHDLRLHALRAPGNTCLTAIRTSPCGGTTAQPINNSKGCGTVMRAAPFGLSASLEPDGGVAAYRAAVCDAALTHGHRLAWEASGMLAQMIDHMIWRQPDRGLSLDAALMQIPFCRDGDAHTLTMQAIELANDIRVSDLDGIHALGEGWVAEEALAIAVFCAVRHQSDFAAALRAAVNHRGDSDSTGAICGNLLGAWLGADAVAAAFDLEDLELHDLIEQTADHLFDAFCPA